MSYINDTFNEIPVFNFMKQELVLLFLNKNN